jgi:hypothetical protein
LRAIVRNLEADGAIVLRAAPECIDWVDVTFAIYTFGIPNLYRKMAGPNFSIGIYEGAASSLVWQRYDSLDFMCWDNSGCVADKTRFLLRTLENAVPAALVDPVTSSSK